MLEASAAATARGDPATLALVLETEGSTYVRAGAMALFGAREGQVGWLSGGCVEPEIEQRAAEAAAAQGIDWIDIDTRSDEDLFAGSAQAAAAACAWPCCRWRACATGRRWWTNGAAATATCAWTSRPAAR
nr:XdhC family protein [Lysobacter enzymogenes]